MIDNDDLKRALAQVSKALKSDHDVEAARKLVEVLAHDVTLQATNLMRVLSASMGKSATMRLVRAFATYPCIGCKNGLDVCDDCEGKGSFADDRICDLCIGLGVTDCGFCAGSGLITYNFVPVGLRLAVVVERSQLVCKRAEVLLSSRLPEIARTNASEATKLCAKQLLAANRLMDALNNAVGETRPVRGDPASERLRARVRSVCLNFAKRLDRRVRELLGLLHESAVLAAKSTNDSSKRRALARRANFYKKLSASPSFHGTGLFQVFLDPAHRA